MSQNSGKSLVALGLADSLIKRADRVGFFRPVFDGATISDDPVPWHASSVNTSA